MVYEQVRVQVWERVEEQIRDQVQEQVQEQVRERVEEQVREQQRADEQLFSEKEETDSTSELIWVAASYMVFVVYLIFMVIGAIQKVFG